MQAPLQLHVPISTLGQRAETGRATPHQFQAVQQQRQGGLRHRRSIPQSRARDSQDDLPSDAEVVPLRGAVGMPEERAKTFEDRYTSIKAVVVGAGGKTGQAITRRLLQAPNAKVKGLVRDEVLASRIYGGLPSLQLESADVYQYATLQGKLEGFDILFIATGARPSFDPFGPFNVDYQGTVNLVTAAKQQGISKIVLVSSIGVEESFFPQNLFWGILFWKKRAEEVLQRSGIDYTIVRPGGLTDVIRSANIVLAGSGEFGLPPKRRPGSISRTQAALDTAGSNKVVEVIAEGGYTTRLISAQLAAL